MYFKEILRNIIPYEAMLDQWNSHNLDSLLDSTMKSLKLNVFSYVALDSIGRSLKWPTTI